MSTSALNDSDPLYALKAELLDRLQGCYLVNPNLPVTARQLALSIREHPANSRCFCWVDTEVVRSQLHWLAREGDVTQEPSVGRLTAWSLGQPGRDLMDAARRAGMIP